MPDEGCSSWDELQGSLHAGEQVKPQYQATEKTSNGQFLHEVDLWNMMVTATEKGEI
jgi:hypothetical protein